MQHVVNIPFNSTNPNWTGVLKHDCMFLTATEQYINDLLMHRGYVYFNLIYELLGCPWNPDDRNPCIKVKVEGKIPHVHFSLLYDPDGLISAVDIYVYS
jgi:hypothetical protein